MRQAAWVDGFGFALGSGYRNWWLALLQDHCDGNEAGGAFRLRRAPSPCGFGRHGPIGVLLRSDVQSGCGSHEVADLAGKRR